MNFAAWLGRFIGAVLVEAGPYIVEIVRSFFPKNTAEDSNPSKELSDRLRRILDEANAKEPKS